MAGTTIGTTTGMPGTVLAGVLIQGSITIHSLDGKIHGLFHLDLEIDGTEIHGTDTICMIHFLAHSILRHFMIPGLVVGLDLLSPQDGDGETPITMGITMDSIMD